MIWVPHVQHHKHCLKGTHRGILEEIEQWTRDFNKSPIYWLNGLARTGKSNIAQTTVERLPAVGQLGELLTSRVSAKHIGE